MILVFKKFPIENDLDAGVQAKKTMAGIEHSQRHVQYRPSFILERSVIKDTSSWLYVMPRKNTAHYTDTKS